MSNDNKKRKKTGLKRQTKFIKQEYGGGGHVDQDTYKYFSSISTVLKKKFEDKDEQGMVVNNALEQTEGKEYVMARDRYLSRVLEDLLPRANDEILERFTNAFTDLQALCQDRNGSHVVQTLLTVCAARFRDNGNDKLRNFVIETSSFIFKNIKEFIFDSYVNQISRTCLQICSGSDKENGLSEELVKNLAKTILKWPEIQDIPNNVLTSGFFQVLLVGLSNVSEKLTAIIIKRFLEEYYFKEMNEDEIKEEDLINETTVPEFFKSMPATRLMESAIEVSKGKTRANIYIRLFLNKFKILSCEKSSFMAVQKFISSTENVSELEVMIDELAPGFSEIISVGNMNIIVALAKACNRLGVKEGDFSKGLKVALNVEHSSRGELVTKLLYPNGKTEKKVNLAGSLLLQEIMQFKKPISVVESLLAIDPTDLVEILTTPQGCHVADAFVKSKSIGEKSRDRLIQALRGRYKELSRDKFGSRVIDAVWSRASMKDKHVIIGELDRSILNTLHGNIISKKLKLDLYLTNKNKWVNSEAT